MIPADLGTPDGPGAAVAAALDAFDGRIDVLVNNAGVGLRKDSETLTVEEMDLLWNVNVRSALLVTRRRAAGDARRRVGLDRRRSARSPACAARRGGRSTRRPRRRSTA